MRSQSRAEVSSVRDFWFVRLMQKKRWHAPPFYKYKHFINHDLVNHDFLLIGDIYTEELLQEYPRLSPKEREAAVARRYGAVFLIGIGQQLSDGTRHDGRAPDYDDWTTPNSDGYLGLNGDIIFWDTVLGTPVELSSMGIRVDKEALLRQLDICGCPERAQLSFHRALLNDELPLSIGGGIGQSRFSMFLLQKAHIGEVQASIWPEEQIAECARHNIHLL